MKKEAYYFFAFLSLILSLAFDNRICQIISKLRLVPLNVLFEGITYIGSAIAFIIMGLCIYFWIKKKKQLILQLLVGTGIAFCVSYLLKILIARPRPYITLNIINLVQHMSHGSFPSMHAAMTFAILPFLIKISKKLQYLWIALACLIAFSRLYLGVHYLSDIIAGSLIGFISSSLILKAKLSLKRCNSKK
ncbi:MAG: phosphatase PAP2 family protein [Nanoarchaeota archaeon]|nr:phosphatase PAP2 family protein [Nanoarchaeota archaeon]